MADTEERWELIARGGSLEEEFERGDGPNNSPQLERDGGLLAQGLVCRFTDEAMLHDQTKAGGKAKTYPAPSVRAR